jgi:hypothetical protein
MGDMRWWIFIIAPVLPSLGAPAVPIGDMRWWIFIIAPVLPPLGAPDALPSEAR